MRIRTRLFLGAVALVVPLTAVQWWLHARQLADTERALAGVATSVGEGLLTAHMVMVGGEPGWVSDADPGAGSGSAADGTPAAGEASGSHQVVERIIQRVGAGDGAAPEVSDERRMEWVTTFDRSSDETAADPRVVVVPRASVEQEVQVGRFELRVVTEGEAEGRFLVVESADGDERRIPIPVSPTVRVFERTRRQGMIAGAAMLLVGLGGAAVVAHRLGGPLKDLAGRAERIGEGELGIGVPVTSGGELGELQRAFGRMSARLAELETERIRWQQREHLAQLGDLSRGLAHTLRNPLNTLGLAVDELAAGRGGASLVGTARDQIRRIDRWLRSFLALAAGDAAASRTEDLGDLVRSVVLELGDGASGVDLSVSQHELPIACVPTALRAAVANLVENATEVAAAEPVEIVVEGRGDVGVVEIRDRGPGLPPEIRGRLFEPHVTTKSGGAGMGLFLARQLVVGMHDGELTVSDRPGGGTLVRMTVPLDREVTDDG